MRITKKLGLLVAVPLVAVVSFAALAVSLSGGQAARAGHLRSLVDTSAKAGELVQKLRTERAGALVAMSANPGSSVDDYIQDVDHTDQEVAAFRASRKALGAESGAAGDLLDGIDAQLDGLGTLRKSVQAQDQTATAVSFVYRIAIADLLSFRDSVPQAGGAPSDLADRLQAANALSRAAEYIGLEEVAVLKAADGEPLTAASQQEITAAGTGYTEAMLTFNRLAKTKWTQWFDKAQTGSDMVAAQKMERAVQQLSPGDTLDIDPSDWTRLMGVRANAMLEVGSKIDADVGADVTSYWKEQLQLTWLESLGVAAAVAVAIVLAILLGRPVVRGLRRLRDVAHQVATRDLPEAVAQLDNHEVLGELTPEQFADGMKAPVEVTGKDELAEVGHAFNEVHREAVRVAAQQALLRLHIAAIFVNLARRGHLLAGRLTSAIDEAESRELDPERLERLFTLDHLVTLLGRSNDSLLVLGGTSPAKVRTSDEPLRDVLTAAQSQIEQYARVEMMSVDGGFAVRAVVVDDVVKLLAELMDNAARYSQSPVRVDAHKLADRLIIQIGDSGIGIEPSKLDAINSRLATRPPLDLEAVRSMGLTVVGHIASRLGIIVQLRNGHPGGTLAEITLPGALLTAETVGAESKPARGKQPGARPVPRLFREDAGSQASARQEDLPAAPVATVDDSGLVPVIYFDRRKINGVTGEHAIVKQRPRNPFEDGWLAAAEASSMDAPDPDADTGLPRRTPGERLVPGGETPDKAPTPRVESYRDPHSVGATYSAYARGRPSSPASPPSDQPKAAP
ncbi:MAG TPA: nitrate- and nitrite sensing domain-containing protein [Stackebrandtia sp.]|jgi:signal transduction histidine kinase|uniref:sensor histidine kinase n=1 Tax=Stackebrandtia sp. TaxID=2023065 RepID=UPI002D5A83B7|nr:nitrate- and nitrite sensing domain-containing protein [Stackebrandtia sp.]HZE39366.1 nitrate- and nitrite sensing domain-containing protein [Stackebrandtia sp.]